jgi:hypothetical protein
MSYEFQVKSDKARLYGHVASLPCQRCGRIGQTQVSHSNQLRDGKGRGLKAYPWRVAALCDACHVEIDNGKNLSRHERFDEWDAAHRATIGCLFENGLLRPT